MNSKGTAALISLGCDKNRVDSETILYRLAEGGYDITENYAEADVVIVNTCAFIAAAEKEAVDTIFDVGLLRNGKLKTLVVTGCLPQRYGEKLAKMLPEVDCFVGINDYDNICAIIENHAKYTLGAHHSYEMRRRILSTPPHYAYLKIAEGCDNKCTYCMIPFLRGHYRSADEDSLVREASELSDSGVKELIIVAQDTTRYGKDLYGEYRLKNLLKKILKSTDFVHIRMLYCYPELIDDELIDLIASEPRMAKYIDVPLQHVSDGVLRRMGRKSRRESIEQLFCKLQKADIKVRTTFMVGFPGETDEDFAELCDFVVKYKPYHVGIFAYSRESGSPAARMPMQVPKSVKRRRVEELGRLHKQNAEQRNRSLIGTTMNVMYEDVDWNRNMFVGRTEFDAPEIDGNVYFTGNNCEVGETYAVKISGFDGYDLIGEQESEHTD